MILIALGSNRAGAWGDPAKTLERVWAELDSGPGQHLLRRSSLYRTAGVGPGRASVFVNAVASITCHCGPEALLRRLKQLERAAGPRSARRWGPRPLDLDILDYRGLVIGWSRGRQGQNDTALRNTLVLPHPLMHVRPFVLGPLAEIAPDWRHPIFHLTARQLWARINSSRMGRIIGKI